MWTFEYRITLEDPAGVQHTEEILTGEQVPINEEIWAKAAELASDKFKVMEILKRVVVSHYILPYSLTKEHLPKEDLVEESRADREIRALLSGGMSIDEINDALWRIKRD